MKQRWIDSKTDVRESFVLELDSRGQEKRRFDYVFGLGVFIQGLEVIDSMPYVYGSMGGWRQARQDTNAGPRFAAHRDNERTSVDHCHPRRAVFLFLGLQIESPENGNSPVVVERLLGIWTPKVRQWVIAEISNIAKSAFGGPFWRLRWKFSGNHTGWLATQWCTRPALL